MANDPCKRCGLNPARARGLCSTCSDYKKRHSGADRPYTLIERVENRRNKARWCKTCGDPKLYSLGLCKRCCQYRDRTGKQRPSYLFDEAFRCMVCGYPKAASRGRDGVMRFFRGRCGTCATYYSKYERDRPAHLWGAGIYGFCLCGYPANNLVDGDPLCDRCLAERAKPMEGVAGDNKSASQRGTTRW